MKKSLSLILSALMLASVLTACAPAADRIDPAITLASSDAQTKAEWLNDRLDVIPDDVVLGIGSNTAYGIDMTTFESDGYIARAIGGEVLLFGKTADGLDRAVREYAKAADIGATAELDTVYHEGLRVEKLTIAGRDISEYTVVYNYDRDAFIPDGVGKTVGNAKLAAEEFVRLTQKATGVTLPTATEDVATPMIKIDYVEDGSCGENGFNYKVENGNLYINGAPEANGCANGVYHFFEYQCGWDSLMYGDSDLREAELVDVAEGTARTVDPIFDYVWFKAFHALGAFEYKNDRNPRAQKYYGVRVHANHGMQTMEWSGHTRESVLSKQICYTSESNYMSTFDSVWSYVDNCIANGLVIGESITTIDISQGDNFYYCICSDCQEVFRDENKAHSGAVVRFANRLAEDMEAEGFGGLAYQIFAYWNSNKPCITAPRPDVYVTFCTDRACSTHPIDGSECYGASFGPGMSGGIPDTDFVNNNDYAEWIEGWGEICDNLYLWHYAMSHNYGSYTYYRNIYDDMMFMKEAGFSGFYFEGEYNGLGFGRLRQQLINLLIYNPDLTEEEYNTLRNEIMRREYGDGYDFVQDYIDILEETEVNVECFNCWDYDNLFNATNYNKEVFYARAEECLDILEKAMALASCEQQEDYIKTFYLEVLYRQCAIGYFKAYDEGDDETIIHLEDQYARFIECSYEAGIVEGLDDGDYWPFNFSRRGLKPQTTLESAAWIDWLDYRDDLTFGDREQKPMPDKWVEWYETSTAETSAS